LNKESFISDWLTQDREAQRF